MARWEEQLQDGWTRATLPEGALAGRAHPRPQPATGPGPAPGRERRFLFLQGHPSRFGAELVGELRALGAACHAINLSLGDILFRPGIGAIAYRGRFEDWEPWLARFLDAHAITDIVYYADQRPYHRVARRLARARGIDVFAYEFGYLRPDWITLEKGGLGVFSHFPDRPEEIRRLAAQFDLVRPTGQYRYGFLPEAVGEVAYHLSQTLMPLFFPRYQRDRVYHPLREYLSYLPKLLTRRRRNIRASAAIRRLRRSRHQFHVVALQMQGDYQVRRASHYRSVGTMIEEVIASFAAHADPETHLVIKQHPLENGRVDWAGLIETVAAEHGCAGRVLLIDGGRLDRILDWALGLVTINSTVGLHALAAGRPVKALGIAVYDVPGLTFQGPLDAFWRQGTPPDPALFDDFTKLLMASIQVKGNFFTREGRRLAVRQAAERLMQDGVNGHGAFIDPPPRLARARAAGVPIVLDDA
ncbi:MAG: capsular biosynthesis protein [Pseudomonadota bacterium]